jgi:hypothetical protein
MKSFPSAALMAVLLHPPKPRKEAEETGVIVDVSPSVSDVENARREAERFAFHVGDFPTIEFERREGVVLAKLPPLPSSELLRACPKCGAAVGVECVRVSRKHRFHKERSNHE